MWERPRMARLWPRGTPLPIPKDTEFCNCFHRGERPSKASAQHMTAPTSQEAPDAPLSGHTGARACDPAERLPGHPSTLPPVEPPARASSARFNQVSARAGASIHGREEPAGPPTLPQAPWALGQHSATPEASTWSRSALSARAGSVPSHQLGLTASSHSSLTSAPQLPGQSQRGRGKSAGDLECRHPRGAGRHPIRAQGFSADSHLSPRQGNPR